MNSTRPAGSFRAVLPILVLLAATAAQAGTYLVTSTADTLTAGTLRQGIADANSATCASPCAITFDATLFATTQTINTSSNLSVTANNVTIDGYANGVGSANTAAFGSADNSVQRVVINGPSTTCCPVITVSGTNFTIRGVVIQDGQSGISVSGVGSALIAGCKIGTNDTGTGAAGNLTGIVVSGTSPVAIIGGTAPADRNLISGNSTAGISLQSTGNTVIGNYIGTNAAGGAALANGKGVTIAGSSNIIGNATIGNVISGNTSGRGVEVTAGTGTTINNNRIGTNIAGNGAVGNSIGVYIGSGSLPGGVSVGGTTPNLISGNSSNAVEINSSAGSNTINGNVIGLNNAGTAAIANGAGISLSSSGATNTLSSNIIAGNSSTGISVNGASGLTINNNQIGVFSGTPFGNSADGILLTNATGTTTIFANQIQNNSGDGVDVDGAIIGIGIKQNEIGFNGGLGIDLHAASFELGATANDTGDPDNGAGNHQQNFPLVTAATLNGSTVTATLSLKFDVDSSTVGTTGGLRVEAFEADTDPTNPEGKRFLQGQCYSGNTLSSATMTIPSAGLTPGGKVVLTATSYTSGTCTTINEGTSEFSFPATTVTLQPGFVTNTNDSGTGSLRQAINDANANTCPSPCTITFNIPNTDPNFAGGVYTIRPLSALPSILRDNTVLDGATQTAFGGDTNVSGPEIVINGSLAGVGVRGLGVSASTAGQGNNIEIRSVVVNAFSAAGIVVTGTVTINNFKLLGSYIGTNAAGTAAVANGTYGVFMQNGVQNAQIGGTTAGAGNVISGNVQDGVLIDGVGANSNFVRGNLIGLNAAGTAAIANGFTGISITGGAQSNTIGGSAAGARNVVSGNSRQGIAIHDSGTNTNVVQGNYIGTNAAGTAAIANSWAGIGIWASAQSNAVGGTGAGEGNVISGNGEDGVAIRDANTSTNTVAGNYIGTDVTGASAVANGWYGVDIFTGAANNTVGGSVAAAMNVISGNSLGGVLFSDAGTTGNQLSGNRIGLNAAGSGAISNAGPGVTIANGASGNSIGVVAGNAIAHNGAAGVVVTGASIENNIRFNAIFSNTGLGIDLANNGVTANDAGDGDTGPNALQNFPVLTMASYNSGLNQTVISGTLNSVPSTTFDIDWYSNATLDGSGHGEGQTYENTSTFTSDALGNTAVSILLPGNRRTSNIVATASRVSGPVRETSEFSAPAPNNPPIANNDAPSTNEDTALTFDPRTNDSDPEGGAFTITGNTQPLPSAGSVTCTTTSCTFTPAADYNGSASFNYTITDDMGATATAAVNITVNAINDPPVANTDTLGTNEDTPATVAVLTNDTDVDGPALSVTGNSNGTKGNVVCTGGGACTYTPNPDQTGADSFTYTVSDGTLTSTGTVNVTITAVNDPPVANTDALGTNEDTPNTVNVLTNDTDGDGPSALTVTGSTNGTKGTVSCTAAGACTYTPSLNQNGADSFTYTVSDGSATSTGTVNVTIAAVNDAPVANTDSLATNEDTPNTVNVLTNDSDVDGPSSLTVTGSTNGTKGTVSCTGAGACTYTPNLNQTGADTFTYTVSDSSATATGTVNVTINPVNDNPVANPDTLATNEDTPNTVNVLTNDSDVDGPSALTVTGSTNGTKGTVSCTAAGACTYTPNLNQTGADTFTYTVFDGLVSSAGTVNVTINAANDPPVASPDTLTTNANTPGTVNVLTNDTDVDGPSALSVTGSTNGTKGTVSCTAAGACTYTPNLNQTGADSFTYTVSDGVATATGTVSVTIVNPNSPPNAASDFGDTVQNNSVTLNVLFNDSDPDGQPLVVISNTQPSSGSATCQAGGNCTYTPNAGFTGIDSFTYTVQDTAGATSTATVTINVRPCPSGPTSFNPANNATGVPTTGKLFWDNTNAQTYSIYLGRADANGCNVPFASSDFTFVDYANLQGNTRYSWRVESITSGCPILSSACVTFTTAPSCNITLTLVKPLGGTASSPVEFEWQPVAGATEYAVSIKIGNGNFTEIGKSASTKFTAAIVTDGPIQWFVVATVPGCGNVQSATASFTLCNRPAPPLPRVVGEATSAKTYNVEWDAVPNAIRYEVDEATNPNFTGAITTSTDKTSVAFKHDATTTPLAFYYRVRAFSACSASSSDNSPTVRIVIIPLPNPTEPNPNTNIPAGSTELVVQQVFIPGETNQPAFFTAIADRPWLSVRPPNGLLPPEGITLEVIADPGNLPNGTFTATVIVTITTPGVAGISGHGTSTSSKPISISLVTPVTPVQNKLAPAADSLIIPSVGHLDGINSHWQSDIRVTNVSAVSSKYALTFTPSAGTSSGIKQTTITVGGGETTALDDIIKNWFGIGSLGDAANGMLEIRSADNSPLTAVASSRTYNVTANGTLGQFIPALPFSSFIGKALGNALPTTLSMQQISQSALYRTNVGIVEASGQAASVLLSVFNAAGVKLTDIPFNLNGGEQRQLNSILASNNITLNDGRVEVKVTGGDGKVTAYASVVDNQTQDPLLVTGVATNQPGSSKYVLAGVADITNALANWRTDMRIFNTTLASQTADLTLHQLGGGTPLTASVSLQPGEVRTLDDVVKSLFKVSNVGGAVHVTTSSQANLVVSGRTYNQTSEGTFGQFIEAVTPDRAAGAGGRTLHVLQVEDSIRYRTNLGIAEVTGSPVTVEVQVILPDSKVTPTITFPLAANEFRQLSLRDQNLGNIYNARLAVKVTSGQGRITAYGSVIDMTTQDPTYVPAQ